MRRLRILLLLCTLAALLTISNGQKSVDDETVEGSANVDNPDDEDFDGDQSGLPADDEKTGSNPEAPVINVQATTGQPVLKPTTVIIQPGSVDSWTLDTTTLVILLGALFRCHFDHRDCCRVCTKTNNFKSAAFNASTLTDKRKLVEQMIVDRISSIHTYRLSVLSTFFLLSSIDAVRNSGCLMLLLSLPLL
ncbi:hypothetical protein M3Y98_00349400 [Aphelenchoides besseyi]|nr:hypothetical protein M3Y98_00349400 [Aphelenchoides besseyi]